MTRRTIRPFAGIGIACLEFALALEFVLFAPGCSQDTSLFGRASSQGTGGGMGGSGTASGSGGTGGFGGVVGPGGANGSGGASTSSSTSSGSSGASSSLSTGTGGSGGTGGVDGGPPLYWASGVQQDVDFAMLDGWTLCYAGPYTGSVETIAEILQQKCTKSKLLLACRNATIPIVSNIMAMGLRTDVLFNCASQMNCPHQANGVGWYFNDPFGGWGFAQGGDSVNLTPCDDTSAPNGGRRLCWSLGVNLQSGVRCGMNFFYDSSFERRIYHAD